MKNTVPAPEGHAWCYMCDTILPQSFFRKSNPDVCRVCRSTVPWTEMQARRFAMKNCSHCEGPQPLTAFQKNGDGSFESQCLTSRRERRRTARKEGKPVDGYKRRWYTTMKSLLHCAHCGVEANTLPPSDFHLVHINSQDKSFEIASGLNRSMREFRAEVRKCEALCRACAEAMTNSELYQSGTMRVRPITPWDDVFAQVDAQVQRRTPEKDEHEVTWLISEPAITFRRKETQ